MTEDFITCDFPDLDAFIKKLDLLDKNVNAALREGLNAGADIIRDEQRRRISGKSAVLAHNINKGSIYTTARGTLGIKTGYQKEAFEQDGEGTSPGLRGMIFEFGRPGHSSAPRRSTTMTQKRSGKKYKVKKGAIQPIPHIRAGHDAAVRQASQEVINKYNQVIDKLGE